MADKIQAWKHFAGWLAAAVVSLAGTAAIGQETLRIGKAGREEFSFVPVDVGDREGFFKKRNLKVQISSFAGDARLQQAMAADAIDISLGSGVAMAFTVKG